MKLALFQSITTKNKWVVDPLNKKRTICIEPGQQYALDESFKQYVKWLKFVRYFEDEAREAVIEIKPNIESDLDLDPVPEIAEVAIEQLDSNIEELPQVTRADHYEELKEISLNNDPKVVKIGLSYLDEMTVEQISEMIRKDHPELELPIYNTNYKNYPTKDELKSIAKFGYTDRTDKSCGMKNTRKHAEKFFKVKEIKDLLDKNSVGYISSQTKGELLN